MANPRSASIMSVWSPIRSKAIDRLITTLLFPTPPFPLLTAITLTGLCNSGMAVETA